jgi:hypothetical protein
MKPVQLSIRLPVIFKNNSGHRTALSALHCQRNRAPHFAIYFLHTAHNYSTPHSSFLKAHYNSVRLLATVHLSQLLDTV